MGFYSSPLISKPRYFDFITVDDDGDPTSHSDAVTYVQSTPAATWTISHNKGYSPIVYVLDNDNNFILTDVTSSSNQVVVIFATPQIGKVILI